MSRRLITMFFHAQQATICIFKYNYFLLTLSADDQFLVSFLRGSKYDMNLAKQKIDLFFTMRTMMPEITENRELRYGITAEIMKLG